MIILKIKGGLGNQLFQYSTGRALSIHMETDLKLDLEFFSGSQYEKVYRLNQFNTTIYPASTLEISKLKNREKPPILFKVFNKLRIKLSPYFKSSHILESQITNLLSVNSSKNKDYYLEGWFSNESYFLDQRNLLLKELNLDHILQNDNIIYFESIKNCESVAVHIRRGDYLKSNYFETLGLNYYQKAIELISTKINAPIFFFFSDDMDWVKKEFGIKNNFVFVDGNSKKNTEWSTTGDLEDLMLIKTCKHQIIANSTFSWWGAWLNENPNKIITAPEVWFKDKHAQEQYEKGDLIPSNWIKI